MELVMNGAGFGPMGMMLANTSGWNPANVLVVTILGIFAVFVIGAMVAQASRGSRCRRCRGKRRRESSSGDAMPLFVDGSGGGSERHADHACDCSDGGEWGFSLESSGGGFDGGGDGGGGDGGGGD